MKIQKLSNSAPTLFRLGKAEDAIKIVQMNTILYNFRFLFSMV